MHFYYRKIVKFWIFLFESSIRYHPKIYALFEETKLRHSTIQRKRVGENFSSEEHGPLPLLGTTPFIR